VKRLEEQYKEMIMQADRDPEDVEQNNFMLSTQLQLHEAAQQQHSFLKQQSKILWLLCGDTNS